MKTFRELRTAHSNGESGQAIIFLAAGALFFLAMIVVVADSSMVWWQARNLQNTADAAALAGAQELDGTATSEAPAVAAANEWIDKNISELTSSSIEVSEGYTRIRVTVQKNSGALLSGSLSLGDPEVDRTAVARIASVDILPCVAPIGVQKSFYEESLGGGLVAMRPEMQSDDNGTSNTGLLNLQSGNMANPIRYGSCNTLTDPVTTNPGWQGGDVNNGMQDRLEAAMANNCYTESEVRNDLERCKPGLYDGGMQETAVLLVPVLEDDIDFSGSSQAALETTDSGQTLLAYFWVDGDSTYDMSNPNNWSCEEGEGNSCIIYGKFLENVPTDLSVWEEGDVTEFDPEALIKIVQLVE